mmetsp:Transcript_48590/g.155488  ORF Transcript_48590/g.155488 Transcript_48590/m.155488 type:complete len:416 (+) Transcript_48590:193-1440(+)
MPLPPVKLKDHWTDFVQRRRHDAALIVGNGPSVALITERIGRILNGNLDVFTLNAGHEARNIKPDFYNLEFLYPHKYPEPAKLQAERWRETAAKRRDRFKDTFFTIEEKYAWLIEPAFDSLPGGHPFARLFLHEPQVFPQDCRVNESSATGELNERGKSAIKEEDMVPFFRGPRLVKQCGSSLSLMFNLAINLGYRQLYVIGVDLKNNGHFYSEDKTFKEHKSHFSNNVGFHVWIKYINDHHDNITITNLAPAVLSVLHGMVPSCDLGDFVRELQGRDREGTRREGGGKSTKEIASAETGGKWGHGTCTEAAVGRPRGSRRENFKVRKHGREAALDMLHARFNSAKAKGGASEDTAGKVGKKWGWKRDHGKRESGEGREIGRGSDHPLPQETEAIKSKGLNKPWWRVRAPKGEGG